MLTENFEKDLVNALSVALIDQIKHTHFDLSTQRKNFESWAKAAIDKVNPSVIIEILTAKLEQRAADVIFQSMATEIGNDIKRVMSDGKQRAEVREKVQSILKEIYS